MASEVYLGDGVYMRFDGFSLWLRARQASGDHVVAIDPGDFPRLVQFAQQCWPDVALPQASRP